MFRVKGSCSIPAMNRNYIFHNKIHNTEEEATKDAKEVFDSENEFPITGEFIKVWVEKVAQDSDISNDASSLKISTGTSRTKSVSVDDEESEDPEFSLIMYALDMWRLYKLKDLPEEELNHIISILAPLKKDLSKLKVNDECVPLIYKALDFIKSKECADIMGDSYEGAYIGNKFPILTRLDFMSEYKF